MSMISQRNLLSIFIFVGIVFIALIGCNDRSSNEKHSLKIYVDIALFQDDEIQVFYKLKTDDSYTESLSLKKPVIASKDFQEIIFTLPPNVKPKNLRLDLTSNPRVDSFKVREIKMVYKNLVLRGDESKYKQWFDYNENIHYDSIRQVFHVKHRGDFFDPQFNGTETLNKRLVKLFPPDINEVF